MKKIILIIFSIFSLVIVPIHFIKKIYKEENTIIKEYKYMYSYDENGINFYKHGTQNTLLSCYECTNCTLHNIDTVFYFKDGITIIKDDDKLITFDFINNKTLNIKDYQDKNYDYIKTYNNFLVVTENNILKLIDYKEDDIVIIDIVDSNEIISSELKDNILTIKTTTNTYKVNINSYELT